MFIYWNGKVRNVCFVTALHRNVPNKEHFESNAVCNSRGRCRYRYTTDDKLNNNDQNYHRKRKKYLNFSE